MSKICLIYFAAITMIVPIFGKMTEKSMYNLVKHNAEIYDAETPVHFYVEIRVMSTQIIQPVDFVVWGAAVEEVYAILSRGFRGAVMILKSSFYLNQRRRVSKRSIQVKAKKNMPLKISVHFYAEIMVMSTQII